MALGGDAILQQVLASVADVREALTQERKERVASEATLEAAVEAKHRGHAGVLGTLRGKVEALEVSAAGAPWLGEVEAMRREMRGMAQRVQELEARQEPLQKHNTRYIEDLDLQLQALREQGAADRVRSEQQIVALSEAIERGLESTDAAIAEGWDELRKSLAAPTGTAPAAPGAPVGSTPISTPRAGGGRVIACPSPVVTNAYAPAGYPPLGGHAAASRAKGVTDALVSAVAQQCERAVNPVKRELFDALRQELGASVDCARRELDALVAGARSVTPPQHDEPMFAAAAGSSLATLESKVAGVEAALAAQGELIHEVDDALQAAKTRAQNDFTFFDDRLNDVGEGLAHLDNRVGADVAQVLDRVGYLEEAHGGVEEGMRAHAAALEDLDSTMQNAHASVMDITAALEQHGVRADDLERGFAEFAAGVQEGTAQQLTALDGRLREEVNGAVQRGVLLEAKLETELTEVSARFADAQQVINQMEEDLKVKYDNVDEFIATLDDGLRAVEGILEQHHGELIAVSTVLSENEVAKAEPAPPKPPLAPGNPGKYSPAQGDASLTSTASLLKFQRFNEAREDNIQKYCECRFDELTERLDGVQRDAAAAVHEGVERLARDTDARFKQQAEAAQQRAAQQELQAETAGHKVQQFERAQAHLTEQLAALQTDMYAQTAAAARQCDDKLQAAASGMRASVDAVKTSLRQTATDMSQALENHVAEAAEKAHQASAQVHEVHGRVTDVQNGLSGLKIRVEQLVVDVEELNDGEFAAAKRRTEKNKTTIAELRSGIENLESAVNDVRREQAQDIAETERKLRAVIDELEPALAGGALDDGTAARLSMLEAKVEECVVSVTDLEQLHVDSEGRVTASASGLLQRVESLEEAYAEQHDSVHKQIQEVAGAVEEVEQRIDGVEDELVRTSVKERIDAMQLASPPRIRPHASPTSPTSPTGDAAQPLLSPGQAGRRPLSERIAEIEKAGSGRNSPTSPTGSHASSRLREAVERLSSPRRAAAVAAAEQGADPLSDPLLATPLTPASKKRISFNNQQPQYHRTGSGGAPQDLQARVDELVDEVARLRRADRDHREAVGRLEMAVLKHGGGGGGGGIRDPVVQDKYNKLEADLRVLRAAIPSDAASGEIRVLKKRVELIEDALFRIGAFGPAASPAAAAPRTPLRDYPPSAANRVHSIPAAPHQSPMVSPRRNRHLANPSAMAVSSIGAINAAAAGAARSPGLGKRFYPYDPASPTSPMGEDYMAGLLD
eukprot:TRINITY_DN2773_c0_g2_i1.p1 TRINITY_DN2773_c0_g2~~TRINITY_DN2773_c0_g2_i1.p1  ORF type:complete len:1252 (+),score=499.15 TRINITY_DN2773_c0_g2_i1:80-3835(+)